MTDVKSYIARPIKVEAVQLAQYGDFVRAAAWISESKGKTTAYFKPASKINGNIDTLVILKDGNIYDVFQGDFVIQNSDGEFGFLDGGHFVASFELIAEATPADWVAIDTSRPVSTGKPGKSLLGGAALQVPK